MNHIASACRHGLLTFVQETTSVVLARSKEARSGRIYKPSMMAEEPTRDETQLFGQCSVCVVSSRALDDDLAQELSATIRDNGGEVVVHQSPAPLSSLNEFTHVVSSTIDFPGHDAVCDALIPVVKPQWIHASVSKNKLANPRQFNPDPRLFLNDVVVCCVDIPEGDKDAIIGGVIAMGGLYTPRITSSTTHLVALTMDSDKCKAATSKGLKLQIVLPHWFDDCLKLGKRIDERPYKLPDPEILHAQSDAPVRATTDNNDIVGASRPEPRELFAPFSSPDDSRRDLNVFQGKKVTMSDDLEIGERLRQSIAQVIQKGGGQITDDVQVTDIYICRYRDGDGYRMASRLGKDVGNLSWLYHLITHNTWTSPLRRLLHYPIAKDGIPGFKNFRISLSNYAGEARVYLENLIIASGAECTKTLKQDNTHLITAHGNSEKCAAAREWNLHVVNHLWLEDSYAKWQPQTISAPRYTHFPRRTNLGEVVGQTRIDRFAVEAHFFPSGDNQVSAHKTGTAGAMRQKDKNIRSAGQNVTNGGDDAQAKQVTTSNTATPKGGVKGPKPNGNAKSKDGPLQTPQVSKFVGKGKENETPSTTGSRKSKDAATARLHDYAPDIALYEKERKRAGGVIYGGRRKSDNQTTARKRSAEPEEGADEDAVETKKSKKFRPPVSMHLLITGYSRWVGDTKREDAEKRHLRELGILLVQDASRCTHLAAPSILRTGKFLKALAYSPVIISCDFITDCLNKDTQLNPDDYILRDKESEKRYDFSLEKARLRAKTNKNNLLQGRTIYCVESINGGFEAYKSIIETNGGQCALFRGRAGTTIPSRRAADDKKADDAIPDREVYLISGVDKNHQKLWPKFRTMAHNAKKVPRIVNADWLLNSVLCQELRWKDEWEREGGDVEMADE